MSGEDKILNEFERLKREKLDLVFHKHTESEKQRDKNFNGCIGHLIEEFAELIISLKQRVEKEVAGELVDISNMCDLTYIALKNENERGKEG